MHNSTPLFLSKFSVGLVLCALCLPFFVSNTSASELTLIRDRVVRGEEVFDYVAINEFFVPSIGQELFKLRNTSTIVKRSLVPELTVVNKVGKRVGDPKPIDVSISSTLNGRHTIFACVEHCESPRAQRYLALQSREQGKYRTLSSLYSPQSGEMLPTGPVGEHFNGVYVLIDVEAEDASQGYDSYVLTAVESKPDGGHVATIEQTRFSSSSKELFKKSHEINSGDWLNVGSRARLRFTHRGGLPLFLVTGVSNARY